MNRLVSDRDLEAAVRATAEAAVLRGALRPDLVRDEVLAELFATTAAARGYRIAYVAEGGVWTYAQVHAASDSIARGLTRAGIGPGDVVGLWMPRSVELLIAQIAITKAGAAWLPFDAEAPIERIGTCLADAAAKALLTDEASRGKAAAAKRPVLTSADLDDPTDMTPLDPRGAGLTADHPAYLIYTSGSTGAPKGIVVTHRNICHFLRAANEVYGLQSDDVMFQSASLAFDLSMEEIWVPYLVGATLFVATPAMLGDVERLPDIMREAGVTVLDMVPTLLAMLPREVPSVRLILARRRGLGAGAGRALGKTGPALLQHLWARPRRRSWRRPPKCAPESRSPSVGPSPTTVATWPTTVSTRCRPACPGSCSSAAPASPTAISAAPISRPRNSSPIRSRATAAIRSSTARATPSPSTRTATSCSTAASTTR